MTTLDRWSLDAVPLASLRAHDGAGEIRHARVAGGDALAGCRFIDLAILPPGASIGRHRHGEHEEEFYLVLRGHGRMWRDGELFEVRAGDLVRNRPGGAHGLSNDTADEELAVFVFEVPC